MTISMASTLPRTIGSRAASATLRGTPASPGVGRGTVRWVRDVRDVGAAPPRSVVVADRLPAAWVTLLQQPAAVLVACGGALTNAATALRERGVPALAAVSGLAVLRDGDELEVDGSAGTARRF